MIAIGGNPQRLQKDLQELCRNFPNLNPSCETYMHTNGSSEMLVKIEGVVPIHFRRNAYNIPVNLWVPSTYPHKEPTCYVTPTSNMIIKHGHTNVDNNGLMRFPYISDWSSNHSTLVGLCTVMVSVFSQSPPVNAKPPNYQPHSQMQQFPRFQQPFSSTSARRPSYESVVNVTVNANGSQSNSIGRSGRSGSSVASVTGVAVVGSSGVYTVPSVTVEPSNYTTGIASVGSASSGRLSSDGLPTYSAASNVTTSYSTKQGNGRNSGSAQSRTYGSDGSGGSGGSGGGRGSGSGSGSGSVRGHSSSKSTGLSNDDIMRDALQQKLGVHCKAIEKQIKTESDREDALEKGAQTIAKGVKGLQTTQERLEKSIEMIEERDQQLAAWVEKQEKLLNSQSELTPEEMLKPSDTMSEQLFECAATVAAIEDVLYHLGRALQNEVIDLKTYLKQVRTLSTKQFLAKALAMKIQKIQTEEHASSSSGMSKSSSGLAAPPSYNSVWEGKT